MTLAIGDRVRFKEDYNSECPRHVRQASTGLVRKVQVAFNGGRLLTVDVDEGPRGVIVYDFRVEKIKDPAPKFQVGDRVRSTQSCHQGYGLATVVNPEKCGYIEVMFDNHKYPANCAAIKGAGTHPPHLFEKVESVPFFLRNGDIVVNRKTGRKGEVIRGMVYDVKGAANGFNKGVPAAVIEEHEDHYPGTYDLIKKDAPW